MAQSQDDKKDKPVYGAVTVYREGGHFILKRKYFDESEYDVNTARAPRRYRQFEMECF